MHPNEYKVRACIAKRKIVDEGLQEIIISGFCMSKPNLKTKTEKIIYCAEHMGLFAQYVNNVKQTFENLKKQNTDEIPKNSENETEEN